MVPLFSLAGTPPLSGFVAKVAVVTPMFAAGQYTLAAIALCVSLLTVWSMARLWEESIWKPPPMSGSSSVPPARLGMPIVAPIAFLVILTLGVSVFAGPISGVTMRAAEQLLDRDAYVHAVLGEALAHAAR
jgi:multicomponent Na+:H+ antiporter subunit D